MATSTQEHDSLHKLIDQKTQRQIQIQHENQLFTCANNHSFIYSRYSIQETTDYSINDNLHHPEKVLVLQFKYMW